jgi:hypothetical protein
MGEWSGLGGTGSRTENYSEYVMQPCAEKNACNKKRLPFEAASFKIAFNI